MRLQISTRLAIFAVLELTAREGCQLSVADIGEKYGVSSHHLAKVMHVGHTWFWRWMRILGGSSSAARSSTSRRSKRRSRLTRSDTRTAPFQGNGGNEAVSRTLGGTSCGSLSSRTR